MSMRIGIGIWLLFVCFGCSSSPPTEPHISSFFDAHRPTLERILEMSNEDYARTKVTRIAPGFTRQEDNWGWPRPESELGISVGRWDEYRKLFKAAGLSGGIDRENGDVRFPKWGEGLADNSHQIGIVFSPNPPTDISAESQRIRYKHLADAWYYYEWVTW